MSLNWQFTDKARFKKLTKEEKEQNDCFVWAALFLDIRDITEKNATEWVWRWTFGNKLNGPYFYRMKDGVAGEPFVPTLAEVKKRIGFTTNVSTRTRRQFIDKAVRIFNETQRFEKQWAEEAAKECDCPSDKDGIKWHAEGCKAAQPELPLE